MTAAILFPFAILAVVALYGLHVWREVRMAQTNANRDMAKVLRGDLGGDSQAQRMLDVLERATALLERLGPRPTWKPKLEVDNDPTGGDAA